MEVYAQHPADATGAAAGDRADVDLPEKALPSGDVPASDLNPSMADTKADDDRAAPDDVPAIDLGPAVEDAGIDAPLDHGDAGTAAPGDVPGDVPGDIGRDVPGDAAGDVPRDVGTDVAVDGGGPVGVPPDPVAYRGVFPARTGRFQATLTVAGEARVVELAVPARAVASPPLLVVFHGTNADGQVAMVDVNAQALAEREGVVIAAPTARFINMGDFSHATAETYWETATDANPDTNRDVLLARAILVEAGRAYRVDPGRVYVLGHSSGGFFAQFTASLLSERIAAFSANSAGLVRCPRMADCAFQGAGTTCAALRLQAGYCACAGAELPAPVRPAGRMPPALLTHGSRDPIVSVYYSCALAEVMAARGSTAVTRLFDGEGHTVPPGWPELVWPFFAPRRLGGR